MKFDEVADSGLKDWDSLTASGDFLASYIKNTPEDFPNVVQ